MPLMLDHNAQNNLKNLLDYNPMSTFQIAIVAICFILNFNDGIDVLVVTFSSTDIIKEWGLSKAEMGYIFSAGLAGMTMGAFLLAPQADKIGRRKMFIISLLLITAGMVSVYFCPSYGILLCLRFITGLGIGGILPSLTATASEFSNLKNRDFSVSLVQAGWPIGAILTGFFCAYTLPTFGWRFVFLMAGCISALMLIGVLIFMTDSPAFLINKQPINALPKLNSILSKMGITAFNTLPKAENNLIKPNISTLLAGIYKKDTLKLWFGAFFGFITLYTIMSWIPNIAKDAGLPFDMAIYVGIALNLGAAIGSASIGAVGAKFGLKRTILAFMIMAFILMQIYGNLPLSIPFIFLSVFAIGLFVQGGFNGIWPTLARVYPAEIRTTGVGLTVGIGRFGAILGPSLFGILTDAGLSKSALFFLFSIPLLIMGITLNSLQSKSL
jgi:MFS transporter, AAHS family, 4-hydroxybenzoate transporter